VKHTIFLAPMLCISLLFSCTYVERDNHCDSGGKNYKGCQSSVKPSSSSSVVVDPSGCRNAGSNYSCSISGYKTVEINGQVWMAQNLNCDVEGSKCYDNETENCNKLGRLYDWCTAIAVCPEGWHLPSDDEWQELVDFAGGNGVAGRYLKAKSGWNWIDYYAGISGNGEDKFGFSALPGGFGYSDGRFTNGSFTNGLNEYVGYTGTWWTSTDMVSFTSNACYWSMNNDSEGASGGNCNGVGTGYWTAKTTLYSVRCLKN